MIRYTKPTTEMPSFNLRNCFTLTATDSLGNLRQETKGSGKDWETEAENSDDGFGW